VNDFDIVALVHSMREGMARVQEFCEILIAMNGSSEEYKKKYQSAVAENVRVISSEKNIGEQLSETG